MPIDDPIEKIRQIISEDGNDPLEVALSIGGPTSPVIGIVAAVKDALDGHQQSQRMRTAILALADEMNRMENRWPKNLSAALESAWFKQTVKVLLRESADSDSAERAAMLARATAHGCFPDEANLHRQEDVASYIRDLAQLASEDVSMLKLLKEAYAEAFRVTPNLHDPNYFTQHFENFKRLASERKIDPDDCVAIESRLVGFGLAVEAPRNSSRQSPGEYCFRPTKRGLYLLSLLEAAEVPLPGQN